MVLERPAVSNDPQALKRRTVACFPVIQKIREDRVEFFLRRVPRLIEVVVDPRGIDGADRGLSIGVRGKKHPARIGVDLSCVFEEFHASHAWHALVAK